MADTRGKKSSASQSGDQKVQGTEGAQQEELTDLRQRLYSRGNPPAERARRNLSPLPQNEDVRGQWNVPPATSVEEGAGTAAPVPVVQQTASTMPYRVPKKKQYRMRLFIAGFLFFVAALILSSLFLLFGQNTISGSNIAIDIDGPFVIGGGEEMTLQIAIANRNAVPVESATLIVEYPTGTQSAEESGKELFRERISLDVIQSGEVFNVPARAIIFGEENEEKEVKVSIEYRVEGSNATFFKEADPLRFKISSSPIAVRVDAIKEITSGQEAEIDIVITSNAPTRINDILVEAEYPFGFDYSIASPPPVGGQNVWSIDALEPGEEYPITIRGIVVGKQDEDREFTFAVGVPNERDAFTLASVSSTARHTIRIAEAFIALAVEVDESSQETVSVPRNEDVQVDITFENTLPQTVYDVEIKVQLEGSALDADEIQARSGFYNSTDNTVVWRWTDVDDLREVVPGESHKVSFTMKAREGESRTPQIQFTTSVSGKRVSEDRVPETLTDGVSRTVRFESVLDLSSHGVYSTGPFVNTGPIQPVAESLTQYTVILTAENGSNDITDASVTAELPLYVTWLDLVTGGDVVTYNTTSREITWDIGSLDAGRPAQVAFQISVLPSVSQVGSVPTILGQQRLKATDRFTGTVLRSTAPAITTKLLLDPNEDAHEGTVLPVGSDD